MLIDYAHFGDVVSFDTTFCTNKEYRPFGVFVGFNHHRGICIFGAALLYDETLESFRWLFEAFIKVHGQKKPLTIFSYQDAAIRNAICKVFPDKWHGLCTWHIMQNGIKHLGNLIKDGSCFLKEFKTCMYHYEGILEFENAWEKLHSDYQVKDSSWLNRIYKLKEKWAKCYTKNIFTLGIRSTQLNESLNGDLKDYLKSSLDLVQFFKHFERVVNDKHYNELKEEFDARNKTPRNIFPMSPIILQALQVYTPVIFKEFQDEYIWISACFIKFQIESVPIHDFVVSVVNREGYFNVKYIKFIPANYLLRRWTLGARNMIVESVEGTRVEKDVNLDFTQHYRLLCPKLVRIASEASNSSEGYALFNGVADDLCAQLQNLAVAAPSKIPLSEYIDVNIGFKKKTLRKGGKHYKSWVKKQRKTKKTGKANTSRSSHLIQPSAPSQSSQWNPSGGSEYMDNNLISFAQILRGSIDYS
ncbi:protein FAR1-RELATED SEQUENCE 5-like [Macadamia integrifolia]|uniref:protein FAR1-RELATED SEQUENCE 5-like n=1 Tax=Macadamia integrifolia TaxID=60698 RepID=UPI001C4FE46E|nr:protein FAR1-RELATED SEQUENCE 5-like [Macadamia integrifolia]